MDVLAKLRANKGGWCFQKEGDDGQLWTHGSFTPDDAADEIERLRAALRAIRNHWNEFGPEHGFEETLERSCMPIDINQGQGSTWAGLPK